MEMRVLHLNRYYSDFLIHLPIHSIFMRMSRLSVLFFFFTQATNEAHKFLVSSAQNINVKYKG